MALALFLFSFIALSSSASVNTDPGYDCRPGQACWPNWQEWQQLNNSVNGNLYQTIPMGASCYTSSPLYNAATCDAVVKDYNQSIPRGDYYGQTYWSNWEACGSLSCSLLSSDPEETLYQNCSLGRLASYYVDVRNSSHISATLQFAQAHNIRISIKNTGHDFYGRSSVPGSLAIWTHNMNSLQFYKNFTAYNCPSASGLNVGEIGAGVVAGHAYDFFGFHGMDVTGGYEQSVGLAGGFGQGGGLGSFTTTYGLMADNAVEFEVVTADGNVRTINECNDPDLFWAMRGGGGGTYAVLTKFRVQVYPSVPIHVYNFVANFTRADVAVGATKNRALRDIMTFHASHQLEWSSALVTGQVEYFPEAVAVGLVLPYGDNGSKLRSTIASFVQFLRERSDLTVIKDAFSSYDSYADYLTVTAADAENTEPGGIFSLLTSRLIPRQVFEHANTIDALVDGVIEGVATARSLINRTGTQVVLESPLTNPDINQTTSVLPAWRDAIWHVIHVGEWYEPLIPAVQQKATDGFLQMTEPLKQLSPGGGAYFNEANYQELEWQETFFGANYNKLLEIKNKYDPTHLFDCWKCVGWRGEKDPFYSCYQEY
ncbi:FAD binding domain-containing protein [Talaromyces proteolyticus]|uniref:FAD binding domain-containing protein n=1 Tax=Talaromyces proteolyticus TaxID=1131652 RepID=A0AAD4KHH7_9EURO|nr:FAD binding domain-containing protein [Talaromyces proteolyticus]KAH8691337.1 FAD binding domain-containing protein [Talaromyces proteolyticus]